jgi:ribA/ribD-fused uncharacterized protein
MKIQKFDGPYFFLSNFYHAPIYHDGIYFHTNEHAFQASKTYSRKTRLMIRDLVSPHAAKAAGRSIDPLRPDWESIKEEVMFQICLAKFVSDPHLRQKLIDTGKAVLEEGNTWGDTYWGVVNGKGRNALGCILMKIRGLLR